MVLIKPTLAPFALFGIRSRGWWLMAGAMAAVSVAMLPLDLQYVTAIRNVDAYPMNMPWLYLFSNVPLAAVPVAAWALRGVAPPRLRLSLPKRGAPQASDSI